MGELKQMRTGIQRDGLLDLIADLPEGIVVAEIGSFAGESAELFLRSGKVEMLYAIDPWEGGIFVAAEELFNRRMAMLPFDLLPKMMKMKMRMEEAIKRLPRLDAVYIDGDHHYSTVLNDIRLSSKAIRPDGIIAGHDYSPHFKGSVILAVDYAFGRPDKTYRDGSWAIWLNGRPARAFRA